MVFRQRALLCGALLGWLLALGCGMFQLLRHEFEPGRAAQAPPVFPYSPRLRLDPLVPTLVMVVHPQCPCSRASLEELSGLLSRNRGRVRSYCLLVWPASQDESWLHDANWQLASRISGLELVADREASESVRLGARTSGQTYLYGADGRLLFSGGVTGSRGHAGGNSSLQLLEGLLAGSLVRQESYQRKVFGCEAAPPGKEIESGRCCAHKS